MATQEKEKINKAQQSRRKSVQVQNPKNGKMTDNLHGQDIWTSRYYLPVCLATSFQHSCSFSWYMALGSDVARKESKH